MPIFLSALIADPIKAALSAFAVVAALALLATGTALHFAHAKIDTQNRTIGQLQGTVVFQNDRINHFNGLAVAAQKRARTAREAATAAHARDEATIAGLLGRPLQTDPTKACEAADAAILEFAK